MQGYCDVYKWTILKRTSPEVKCLHPTSSRREMCTLSVSNVIYHKFSHGAAFYTLNGKNVNVMLEFTFDSKYHALLKCNAFGTFIKINTVYYWFRCACGWSDFQIATYQLHVNFGTGRTHSKFIIWFQKYRHLKSLLL